MLAPKPTARSFRPLRATAPARCTGVNAMAPTLTFWKALSGQWAKTRVKSRLEAAARPLIGTTEADRRKRGIRDHKGDRTTA